MKVILERHDTSDEGTFGILHVPDLNLTFYTGELPWRDNETDFSCIPVGEYKVIWDYSNHFKRFMYHVTGVDGRQGIKIHSANLMGDSKLGYLCQLNGCIALGEKLGTFNRQKAVLLSHLAVKKFEDLLHMKPFTLEIRNA